MKKKTKTSLLFSYIKIAYHEKYNSFYILQQNYIDKNKIKIMLYIDTIFLTFRNV
jgi:hypothetical protein